MAKSKYFPDLENGKSIADVEQIEEAFSLVEKDMENAGEKADQVFSSTSKNAQSGVAIAGELEKYQPKLTFDDTPTQGSDNPVTSDGVNEALNDYVKFTDYASYSKAGVAKVDPVGTRGISIDDSNFLTLVAASPGDIDGRTGKRAITPLTLNMSVKAALTDSKRITGMTETEKSNARDVIGAEQKTTIVPWESTLTEMSVNFPGITEYVQICDHEITTLSLGVSGPVPVGYECSFTFQSGATATTITYPGELFKFVGVDCDADGDFVASANTNYEVSVRNLSTNPETPLLVARVGVY